jgi:eukaryotic-like serine/threonine-protein kinase
MIGRTLSHYRILERIGAGGMGVVFRAHDERLERDVALKVLPAGLLSDESSRKRFRKEALALSRLNHPNIATVHDFDTQDGIDFLVMEYVAGETLEEMLRRGPLPEAGVVRLGRELAHGLAAAHAAHIIHRDLKPGNARLTPEGRLKILDFGLARLVEKPGAHAGATTATTETETSAAHSGAGPGTLPYMAPEQLRGRPASERSDLWGAGLVLYELATARRAFPDTGSTRLIAAILQEAPPPPRSVIPKVSLALESVILKCLEKDPDARYRSATELERDLERIATGQPVALPRRRGPTLQLITAVSAAALIAAAAALNVGGLRHIFFGGGPRIHSLAVLPLANYEGADSEYFADGMTDQLITTLAQIGSVKVISRTSIMAYKNSKESLPTIARALHADAIVEGSVSRSGDRVRVTAELIRGATDEHIWAQSYERNMRDVLALQGDLARAIADNIRATLTSSQRARLTTTRQVDPEAYRAYLRGLYAWNKRTTEWIEKAIEYFNQAIAIDPTYPAPYAGLASCYAVLPSYDSLNAPDYYLKSRAASLHALELDSTNAEAHATMAGIKDEWDWDAPGADREFRRAIALNPNYASVHQWYADYLSCVGRIPEAIAEVKKARELDPLSLIINTEVGSILGLTKHYDEAMESLRKTIDMDPSFPRAHRTLANVYLYQGRCIEATWEFEKEDSLLGRRSAKEREAWYGPLRRAFKAGGVKGYYRQLLAERLEWSKTKPQAPLGLAIPHAVLGDADSAFYWLVKARDAHDPSMRRIRMEVWWDNLRSDPRYAPLLRSMGLPP